MGSKTVTTQVTGSDAWWKEKHGPEWQRESEEAYQVTFWWRDPHGSEATSPVRHVWIYITGVTDHHQQSTPQSLRRLAGTDVWCWQTTLPACWRGSYCFIPSENENDFAAAVFSGPVPDRLALREGWRGLLSKAMADPLNVDSWRGGRGHAMSALEMPGAPVQPGWDRPDMPFAPPDGIQWQSAILKNRRRVWIYTTGETNADTPLAILLDGQFWAESMPVWPALAALTADGQLPPAVYVLIDVINNDIRNRELPCNADFWHAVQQELLPLIHARTPFSADPARTLVAGQSFGGLAALYAGLHWPQRFGCVLSQSGSYWWPSRTAPLDGELIGQLQRGEVSARGLRIVLEAGKNEPLIWRANQTLLTLLKDTPQTLLWREVDGGHDALCWRGGLTSGLIALWQSLPPATS